MKMNDNKMALGTAQFGMNYGINNTTGIISKEEASRIFDFALMANIGILDTAYSYGTSEEVIGEYLRKHQVNFKIISKLPDVEAHEVKNTFEITLQRLHQESLYGYLLHSFETYKKNPSILDELEHLKHKGKVKKIGFSLYYPEELESIFRDKIRFDIIQIPYNIFDQRFAPFFKELKKRKCEIYVRSVFLQGLFFKKPENLDGYFEKIRKKLAQLHALSIQWNIPIAAVCLNFVILNKFVDVVIVGVDHIENLKEIVGAPKYSSDVEKQLEKLHDFKEDDEQIILPINWKIKNSAIPR